MTGAGAAAPAVALASISKTFPGVRALAGVDFDVRPGEVHALIGENGAGKSTLIKILAGIHRPDAGQVLIGGHPADLPNPAAALAAGIATIHQELLLFPQLSVAENIFMGHAPERMPGVLDWGAMRRGSREVLDMLDARDIEPDAILGELSVGHRQRVEIAKALSAEAQVLIMDEPTAALTEHDIRHLYRIIRLLGERNVAVIYISHKLDEVFAVADRVTVLRDGELAGQREVAETNQDELVQLMVGRPIDALFPWKPRPLGEPVLEVEDLQVTRSAPPVSFAVRAGEIVGLAGLVGSGRSEIAQALFGIAPAAGGIVRIAGEEADITDPSQARARRLAYVPEDRGLQGLVRPMSVAHNSTLAMLDVIAPKGIVDRDREREVATGVIARFAVRTAGLDVPVAKLSGGNQQKIVIGKWLATDPRLLIMDEPTRGIDIGAKSEIHRLMVELAGKGLAILMISSELPEILGMSDRVLVLREGAICAEFDRAEATQEAVGSAMMANLN